MRKRFDDWGIRHLKAATQLILLPSLSPTLYRIVAFRRAEVRNGKVLIATLCRIAYLGQLNLIRAGLLSWQLSATSRARTARSRAITGTVARAADNKCF